MARMLEDKAVIITGAGQGIGEATALLAASLGASVLVNDIDADAAESVAAAIRDKGGRAHAHAADISQWSAGQALVDACLRRFGQLDGLVNNAGLFKIASLQDSTEADFASTMAVNLVGAAACAKAAAEHMLTRKSGAIVNIVSGAQCGMLGLGAYGASKGALASLTYAWAIELEGTGVRLNAVSPMANTQMATKTRDYLSSFAIPLPDSVPPASANAPVICYLLSDASAAIHGQVVRIDGAVLALMTHPAIIAPVLERDVWTTDAVAEAFTSNLSTRQQRLGVVQVELAKS
jgi:NAD(P)-dependent dehydrogenase (short-subunit alcohol dehydrogenase family)